MPDLNFGIQNEPINELSNYAVLILNEIKNNIHITREELVIKCNISFATVKRSIKELKDKGCIIGKDYNKNGKWTVVK